LARTIKRSAICGAHDQAFGDLCGRFAQGQHFRQLHRRDGAAQAVGAQQVAVAFDDRKRANRDAQLAVEPDGACDDVLRQACQHVVVELRALFEHVGQQRMVLRQQLEITIAHAVAAAVAHVGHVHQPRARRKAAGHDRGAHAAVLG
jgi:hypothetical protein